MQTDKEFEDFFREQLNGWEETPPVNAWNKINKDLKPKRTWYREMAAIALLLMVTVGVYLGRDYLAGNHLPEKTTAKATNTSAEVTPNAKVTTPQTAASEPGKPTSEQAITPQPQLETEIAPAAGTAASTEEVAEIAMNSEVKTASRKNPVHLNGAIAIVKSKKPLKNTGITREEKTVKAENGKAPGATRNSTGLVAIAMAKRYDEATKNSKQETTIKAKGSSGGLTKTTIPATATLNGSSQPITSSEIKAVTGKENGMVSGAETALAHHTIAKTDSVALPTLPLLAQDSAAQTNPALKTALKEKESQKFAMMLTFTPGIIARRLIANPHDEKYLRFNDSKGKNTADLGYDISATFQHRITPLTTIDAGLAYTKLHSNVTYKITTNQLAVVTQPGSGAPTASVKVNSVTYEEEIQNEFTYGGLRVGITQDLGHLAGYAIFASTGAGMNVLLQKSGQVRSEDASGVGAATHIFLEDNAFHNVNSHLYLNAGVKKAIHPGLDLVVAPAFTYYLNSTLRKQQGFELKPYTFGLNLGLRYQF